MPRYPYPGMIRPGFHPRPPGAPGLLPMARPMVPNIPGVRPFIPPIIRPAVPSVTPAEKPQTTVYVGKISPSVKNDFMLSLLQSCGPVKSWKRAEDPSDGTPRGFGFCEFENAEGILRALRLLSKFNIDGQELVLNVNQATREYLDRYVEKKTENSKNLKEGGADEQDTEKSGSAESSEKTEPAKSSVDDSENDNGKDDKGNHDLAKFGIVTDEDKEGDRAAMEKVTDMMEERLKTRPLPPPPPPPPLLPTDGSFNPNIEQIKSRDGDSDTDRLRNDAIEEKNIDETSSEYKAVSEHDRSEVTSPERNRRYDRRSGNRDVKHDKEREMERYEREAERERVRKEREQRRKVDDAEREYEERLRDWEYREREKEKQRQYEKEKEKERERKRRKEILRDEEDEAEESGKRWRRSVVEEKRRKRRQEKEEDLADKVKEDEEIAEAEKRAEEEKLLQQEKEALKLLSPELANGSDKAASPDEMVIENEQKVVELGQDVDSGDANHTGDEGLQNGTGEVLSEAHQQNANAPTRKLGFGLLGSGKRANVPSVFHEEEDDAHKDKKMRPLVPIDYSTEELEAVQPVTSGTQPANLVAAAEYAKQISNIAPREEKSEGERDNKKQRSHDRSGRRDENSNRSRDDSRKKSERERDRDRDHGLDKVITPDKQKLLDAKQLIDMIPKTKDELFSYEVNWAVYDKHALHDRMRPWISKKVTEFLGEEETTLVDYIVSSTKEHVKAAQMLEMLQSILDDEAEMFVLKMWRMLIFEVKKVETGLALKSK
ncbi:RNA-binding motif protein 25 [Linum grandiflorum]